MPSSKGSSRRQFLKVSALGLGGLWAFGGEIALGQIPWEEEKETLPIGDDDSLGLESRQVIGDGLRTESPTLAMDGDRVLIIWLSGDFQSETLWFMTFEDGNFTDPVTLAENKMILHPTIAHSKKLGTVITWAQKEGDRWSIKALVGSDLSSAKVITLDDGSSPINWHPVIAVNDEAAMIVWEQKQEDHLRIIARKLSDSGSWADAFVVRETVNSDARRPAALLTPNGDAWIAWDQSTAPGGSAIFVRSVSSEGQMEEPIQVTHHPAMNHAPALALNGDGDLWIAWHTNRKAEPTQSQWDIPRWIQVRCLRGGELFDPVDEMKDKNLEKEGTDQSFEFARILTLPSGGILITGRPSHNFCFQTLDESGWSRLYRIPNDGWGGRGQHLNAALDTTGGLWIVRRDLDHSVLHRITGVADMNGKPQLKQTEETSSSPSLLTNIQKAPNRWPALEELEGIDQPLFAYYGDIHGHTWNSDGVGDVDEYFRMRKEYYEDDFASLTDHDTFVRKSILPSVFEYQKELTDHYNDENFVTLFGQEYTTARTPIGVGHKCIYDIKKDIPLFDHTNPKFNSTAKINAVLRERGAIWIPHHTGWVGTDWDETDEDVQPLVEICSNHGRFEYMGNRPIQHRGGMLGSFVQDAFTKGLKIGIIGGSDSHGLIWHHRMGRKRDCNRTGLAVVLAENLTREAIFDAIKKRRVYGTTGTKPMLDFRVNNHVMGAEFSTNERSVKISANVMAREDLVYLTVVKDNEVMYEYGGGDFTARFTIEDKDLTPGTHWYYLRVLFDNDEMAWSSPIWVNVV